MKKVVKLKEPINQEKFTLIGISSHENDYRLSWAINTALSLKLARTNPIEVPANKTIPQKLFNCFRYEDEDTMQQFMLIANACDQGYLLPNYKNIDFILKLSGDFENTDTKTYITALKNIDIVTLAFEIPPEKIKNTAYMYWDDHC